MPLNRLDDVQHKSHAYFFPTRAAINLQPVPDPLRNRQPSLMNHNRPRHATAPGMRDPRPLGGPMAFSRPVLTNGNAHRDTHRQSASQPSALAQSTAYLTAPYLPESIEEDALWHLPFVKQVQPHQESMPNGLEHDSLWHHNTDHPETQSVEQHHFSPLQAEPELSIIDAMTFDTTTTTLDLAKEAPPVIDLQAMDAFDINGNIDDYAYEVDITDWVSSMLNEHAPRFNDMPKTAR